MVKQFEYGRIEQWKQWFGIWRSIKHHHRTNPLHWMKQMTLWCTHKIKTECLHSAHITHHTYTRTFTRFLCRYREICSILGRCVRCYVDVSFSPDEQHQLLCGNFIETKCASLFSIVRWYVVRSVDCCGRCYPRRCQNNLIIAMLYLSVSYDEQREMWEMWEMSINVKYSTN